MLDKGYVRYVDCMGSDLTVVNAARASYQKESQNLSEADEKLLKFLWDNAHTSPFRHAFMTLEVKAPLMIARQWWKYVVGSDHCQPAGTMVTVIDGNNKIDIPIEDIKIGDYVYSMKYSGSAYIQRRGSRVDNVWSRTVSEDIVVVTSNNKTTRYTKEHPCVVKLGGAFDSGHVLYLMRKDDKFRVGVTQARRGDSLGLRVRFTREDADEIWVLGVFDDREEALYQEMRLSHRYSIPMTLFKANEKAGGQQRLDRFWNSCGDMRYLAKQLLEDFDLLINEPLFNKDNFSKSMKTQTTFVTAASNLRDGMLLCSPEDKYKGYEIDMWHPITTSRESYTGRVFSLSVEKTHTYVADGILTHNCMDGWNEASRRYVTGETEFYLPEWREAPENSKQGSGEVMESGMTTQLSTQLRRLYAEGEAWYKRAMEAGVCAEQARLFLPAYGLYVTWRWTGSLQSLMHFVTERSEMDAQSEIRQYADAVRQFVTEAFPSSSKALSQ